MKGSLRSELRSLPSPSAKVAEDSLHSRRRVALVCFLKKQRLLKRATRLREKDMARLVAVCRDGEEDYLFLARQIPLYIDDTLTMVMEFPDTELDFDSHHINSSQMKQFIEHHSMLKQQDLNMALMVMSREVFSALAQLVPCVGCRRSVERLFSQLTDSGYFALEPLTVGSAGVLSVTRACLADPRKLYTLFYVHGSKLNDIIDAIPKSKKNKRCQLHSLDTHKPKPLGEESEEKGLVLEKENAAAAGRKEVRCSVLFHFGPFQTPYRGSWMDVWELMSQECRDEVVLIDSACLLETLETYLRKHRFCTDCKNKVLRAYNILVGELDCSKEKGYCAALYEGLRCCPHEHHIHVCCETDFIAHLLGRAEPEFSGGYERRERHAKTIDIAQEEVLTCLGIHLYERLHRIWQKLRAEEQTWQILFYLGIDALRKSFEMAVEKVQGISRLEQLCEELSEEERAKELKQEKKRQKRKNRRKNKCGFDMSEQETEGDKEKSLDEGSSESVDGGCKSCGSGEESGGSVEVITPLENSSCSCPGTSILGSPKTKKGLSSHSNGSDCGYSSSMEGSETGSREGSDVACTEGICNHCETGEYSCSHHCSEDKEEDGVDSCVECWANSEQQTKCKNKKKKRKSKCGKEHATKLESCTSESSRRGSASLESNHDPTTLSTHSCRSEETTCSKLCCGSFTSIALQQPLANRKGSIGLVLSQPPPADVSAQGDCSTKSLMELLQDEAEASDEENCLTQDEIQSFVEENKSFYSKRDQYRQHLKDRFTKYCHSSVCRGEWLPTTSVN
ncbi:gametogenetin-binding protein 2 isoform X1 [Hoplias malabaricus]|uniref:gametogenetin-binding protein 2 isoform X1 n=2 Tax=Hoplias malabaricus TaxID=27720 RepID=UPI0034638347